MISHACRDSRIGVEMPMVTRRLAGWPHGGLTFRFRYAGGVMGSMEVGNGLVWPHLRRRTELLGAESAILRGGGRLLGGNVFQLDAMRLVMLLVLVV